MSTEKGFTKKTNHVRLEGRPQNVKIEGLVADTDYKVRMRARNKVGEGKWTEEFKVKTGRSSFHRKRQFLGIRTLLIFQENPQQN